MTALRNEIKQSFRTSLPLMASSLVQGSSGFVGTVIIAHLGQSALAASVLVSMSWITLVSVIFGILNIVSALVSQQMGAKRYGEINKITAQAVWVAILLAIPVTIFMYFETHLFRYAHQPQAVLAYAREYLHALSWSMFPLALIVVFEQFLIGIGKTRLVMWISLIQIPFEILANYAFALGKFGIPKMGIAGVGYGFTLVFTIAAIAILAYFMLSDIGKRYAFWHELKHWHAHYFKKLLKTGWPLGVMYGSEVAFFTIITFLMGLFGTETLAAHQIALQYMMIVLSAIFGLSQGVTARVGFAAGEENRDGLMLAFKAGIILALGMMLIPALCYEFFGAYLIALDHGPGLSQATLALAAGFLLICALFQMADSARLVAIGALRGINDTQAPLLISLFSFSGLGLLAAIVLAFVFGYKGYGLWWGIVLGDLACMGILVYRFTQYAKTVDLKKLLG